uniref:Uncharacterized protein n=1 Tax=Piliocolobus tephrosceles TaxID=591936 RepID=A0A8C9H229_9PRIM
PSHVRHACFPFAFHHDCKFPEAKDNFNFLHLNRNACYQPMSFRPRILIVGEPGFGQGSHLQEVENFSCSR